jgi:hypothetical protein
MKNYDANDIALIILASTIPLAIVILPIVRMVTGQTLTEGASAVVNNLITGIGVGILTVIAQKYKNKNDDLK